MKNVTAGVEKLLKAEKPSILMQILFSGKYFYEDSALKPSLLFVRIIIQCMYYVYIFLDRYVCTENVQSDILQGQTEQPTFPQSAEFPSKQFHSTCIFIHNSNNIQTLCSNIANVSTILTVWKTDFMYNIYEKYWKSESWTNLFTPTVLTWWNRKPLPWHN